MNERINNKQTESVRLGDVLASAIHEAQQAGEIISDEAARVIAASLHGGQNSAMYSLASNGSLNMGALRDELDQLWQDESLDPEIKDWIAALDAYVSGRPDKGIVDRWHKKWLRPEANEVEQQTLDASEQPATLEERIKAHFAGTSTAVLIRYMERAGDDVNLDDETFELARRMREAGKSWRWNDSFTDPRIIVEGEL